MIIELKPEQYHLVKPLLVGLGNHPVMNGVIEGNNRGKVFVNHSSTPTTALIWAKNEMFIGASPGSTGGGIKTTTFATLLGAVWFQIKGKEDVVFFRNRVTLEIILKALTVTVSGLFLVITITMLLTITEPGKDFLMIFFEATSAFATVGLSMGLTPELSPIGRILIIFTMFAGRVGPLTIAFAIAMRRNKDPYRFPKGKIIIG